MKGRDQQPVLSRRRQRPGWHGFAVSVAVHSLAAAVLGFVILGGQGSEGLAGDAVEDAIQGEASLFKLLPLPQPAQPLMQETAASAAKPARSFQPAGLKRITAATLLAEVRLPSFELSPQETIQRAVAADAAAASKTAANAPPQTPSRASPESSKSSRKAAGTGGGKSSGHAMLASVLPRLISSPPPPYPPRARTAKAEGTATVRVTVSSAGEVLSCSLHRSTGNAELDHAALRAVRRWRFAPGISAAQPVQADVLVRVVFRIA